MPTSGPFPPGPNSIPGFRPDAGQAVQARRIGRGDMKALRIYLALTALTLAVFAVWPSIDLTVANFFFRNGKFDGDGLPDMLMRDFFRVTPFVVLAVYGALWLTRRLGANVIWAPSNRAMVFLIATMIVGPGLVVNLLFKDNWHRPRPAQTEQFSGKDEFRPWYETNGGCVKNCSFVSGEASTGFWMVAPASLLPPPVQGPAIVAAFVFGAAASLLRMAFGGHYLSDVILGGLLTLIIIEVARRLIWPRGAGPPDREAGDVLGYWLSRWRRRSASKPSAA